MSHAHAHAHGLPGAAASHSSAGAANQRALLIVLTITTLYMLAEVVGGYLTNSLALLADAGHMLTDILGVGMAILAIRFAQRPATPGKTYGFYRLEILAALANGIVLFGIAGYILYEAWERFQEPAAVSSLPMLVIGVGGLVVNLISARLLHAGASESLNVRGAFLEVVADLLGSVGVVVAAIVIYFTGWWQVDPIVSAIIGVFILPRTWGLMKSVVDVLLESTPAHIDVAELERSMRTVPGVKAVHDLHVWTITSGFVAMSAHVESHGRPSEDVMHEVQKLVRERFGIPHTTLQVESADHADDGACCSLDPRCLVVGPQATRVAAGVRR